MDQKPGFCRVIPEGSWKSRTLQKTALRPAYVFEDIEEASETRYEVPARHWCAALAIAPTCYFP